MSDELDDDLAFIQQCRQGFDVKVTDYPFKSHLTPPDMCYLQIKHGPVWGDKGTARVGLERAQAFQVIRSLRKYFGYEPEPKDPLLDHKMVWNHIREKWICQICGYTCSLNAVKRGVNPHICHGKEMNKDARMNQWIPVTDRLPATCDAVMCLFKGQVWDNAAQKFLIDGPFYAIGCCYHEAYSEGRYWTVNGGNYDDVTVSHWMPLPELPEEVEL